MAVEVMCLSPCSLLSKSCCSTCYVIFLTKQDAVDDAVSDDDSISVRSSSPYQHIEEEAIKSGYCTKQGVFVSELPIRVTHSVVRMRMLV